MTETQQRPRGLWQSLLDQRLIERERAASNGSSRARAELAALRTGAGRKGAPDPRVLTLVFAGVPERLAGHATLSRAEQAVLHSLTLHATHVQGGSGCGHAPYHALGRALARTGAARGHQDAIARRLGALLSSSSMEEAVAHLRPLLRMARDAGEPIDFAQLAVDLFDWSDPDRRDRVRIAWARAFELTHSEEQPSSTPSDPDPSTTQAKEN